MEQTSKKSGGFFFCRPCCCQLLYSEFLALHFESLGLVHFKLCGSWLNTFHVSPSRSVRLQWTEGPSSSASRSAQLCPILHLRLQVIEHYQFWQLPRATGIWVLPPFTQPAPPKTHTYTPSHTHTQMHTFTSSLLSVSWKDKGWKWKAEQKLSKQRKKQRSEDICRDAKDNEILCPWFHYWLVFNLKQTANHIRDNLSTTLKHRRLLEAITALKLSRWIPGPIT